jgi:hypothetical protein
VSRFAGASPLITALPRLISQCVDGPDRRTRFLLHALDGDGNPDGSCRRLVRGVPAIARLRTFTDSRSQRLRLGTEILLLLESRAQEYGSTS